MPPSRPTRRLVHRTAVYGPVCTVVWEGRSREAPPIPDWANVIAMRREARPHHNLGRLAGTALTPTHTKLNRTVAEIR